MGVGQVGAIYKGFTFDGINSKDYGVFITGEAVYNAPQRDVEFITIPGRNGAYALDHGRYENIEVTYPAGMFADNEADFADGINAFRNAICSTTGYCRLEDDYNTGEYRMAVYMTGLEVTPAQLKAGEFNITFTCKPQRFLTSGETAVALSSGDDITNPTLYDSKPLLQVWGYGDIDIEGQTLAVNSSPLGVIVLLPATNTGPINYQDYDTSLVNNGDTIMMGDINYTSSNWLPKTISSIDSITATPDAIDPLVGVVADSWHSGKSLYLRILFPSYTYTAGSNGLLKETITVNVTYTDSTTATVTYTCTESITAAGRWSITIAPDIGSEARSVTWGEMTGDSSVSALGNPIYFDLDIGEAWKETGGEIVSVNNAVTIPAQLPTLAPGINTITFDNTITQFKIVPRWWQL